MCCAMETYMGRAWMFSISSGKRGKRFCDGLTRRDALQVGAMGFGGLPLADLLRAEARADTGSSH